MKISHDLVLTILIVKMFLALGSIGHANLQYPSFLFPDLRVAVFLSFEIVTSELSLRSQPSFTENSFGTIFYDFLDFGDSMSGFSDALDGESSLIGLSGSICSFGSGSSSLSECLDVWIDGGFDECLDTGFDDSLVIGLDECLEIGFWE